MLNTKIYQDIVSRTIAAGLTATAETEVEAMTKVCRECCEEYDLTLAEVATVAFMAREGKL